MFATLHEVTGVPGPLDETWAEELAAAVGSAGPAAGVLVARRLSLGEGALIALWPEAEDADSAQAALTGRVPTSTGADLTLAASGPFEVVSRRDPATPAAGRPRYLQLTTFSGPRDEAWVRAVDRADEERIWPAIRDVPGLLGAMTLQAADGGRVIAGLSESVEACEEAIRRMLSTTLLPGEDPGYLTGPDHVDIQRLLVAHLPAQVTR